MTNHYIERSMDLEQAKRYAKDLSSMYVSLKKSESRYRALFEYSPVSLWEEDMSVIKSRIDALRVEGIQDLDHYFNKYPEELNKLVRAVDILDANQSALELYGAGGKEEFSRSFCRIMGENYPDVLGDKIVSLDKKGFFEIQGFHRRLSGGEIKVLMNASIPPEFKHTWSTVLVSAYDLTERLRADFLQEMFGRYLSEEVMSSLLDNPDSLRLGGENREVTIMISDLRGFTAISERMPPEMVIQMLNNYFEVMVEILLKHNATINEISGDELLVLFGAPQHMPDRNQRAIACAIDMQNNMKTVNNYNRKKRLPELEMGIGLNDTKVVIGNVGSIKRSKFGVVGSGVNMTSRIESFAVGGQILASQSVVSGIEHLLRIDGTHTIVPKGVTLPITVYEIGGIGPPYNIATDHKAVDMKTLMRPIPVEITLMGGKHILNEKSSGEIIRLSLKAAFIIFDRPLDQLVNIKLSLGDIPESIHTNDFYGKVIGTTDHPQNNYLVRFTSTPPEIISYFLAYIQHGKGGT